jgi:hypothetical protein
LIAATAFFTRRCRHPIARTVSAPAAPRRTDEKKMPLLPRELKALERCETRLEARKTEGDVFEPSSSMSETSRV